MRFCVLSCVGSEDVDFATWLPEHTFVAEHLEKASACRRVQELVAGGQFDAFLNFCDGIEGDDTAGVEVVRTLEELGAHFTGARSLFYSVCRSFYFFFFQTNTLKNTKITKKEMKARVEAAGGAVPRGTVVHSESDAESAAATLPFPLIVKDHNGWGSIALHEQSRVSSKERLLSEVHRMVRERRGALVEQFVEGREFTVLVAENPVDAGAPFIFNPVEVRFANGKTFKTFEVKWVTYLSDMAWIPVHDEGLSAMLKDAARLAWRACGGTGYGRADFRVGAHDGVPYFLEFNANPGMFFGTDEASYGGADFCIHFDPLWDHTRFLNLILAKARPELLEFFVGPSPLSGPPQVSPVVERRFQEAEFEPLQQNIA